MLAAFAGDDVAAEFERDKEDAMQASAAAVEEPSALPGWGTWASSKREPRCVPVRHGRSLYHVPARLSGANSSAAFLGLLG